MDSVAILAQVSEPLRSNHWPPAGPALPSLPEHIGVIMATSTAGPALPFWDPLLFQVPQGTRLTISATQEWAWLPFWNGRAAGGVDLSVGIQAVVTLSEVVESLENGRAPSRSDRIFVALCHHSTPGHFSFRSEELEPLCSTLCRGPLSSNFRSGPLYEIRVSGARPCEWCRCRQGVILAQFLKPLRGTEGEYLFEELVTRIASYLSLRWRDEVAEMEKSDSRPSGSESQDGGGP